MSFFFFIVILINEFAIDTTTFINLFVTQT